MVKWSTGRRFFHRRAHNAECIPATELNCPIAERIRNILCQCTRKSLQKMYNEADMDDDGRLDQAELFRYVKDNVCPEINLEEVLTVFSEIDVDNDLEARIF